MRLLGSLIIFVALFASKAQAFPDTVYFTSNWKISDAKNFTYYRVLTENEGALVIMDHYQSGTVQMIGLLDYNDKNIELAKTTQDLNDLNSGKFDWYNENGTIYYTIDYGPSLQCLDSTLCSRTDTSVLRLEKTYYMNGNVKEEGLTTLDGKSHGPCIEYHPNGRRATVTTYDNGIRIGTRFTYREDGGMIAETQYKNGKKNGTQKWFDDLGRLKETRIYENDKLVKKRKRYLSFRR